MFEPVPTLVQDTPPHVIRHDIIRDIFETGIPRDTAPLRARKGHVVVHNLRQANHPVRLVDLFLVPRPGQLGVRHGHVLPEVLARVLVTALDGGVVEVGVAFDFVGVGGIAFVAVGLFGFFSSGCYVLGLGRSAL